MNMSDEEKILILRRRLSSIRWIIEGRMRIEGDGEDLRPYPREEPMKLLKSRTEFRKWLRSDAVGGWKYADISDMATVEPTTYPCWGYCTGVDDYHDRDDIAYLYAADLEILFAELVAAGAEAGADGDGPLAGPKPNAVIRSWGA